jgi:hypothetical protein
MRHLITRDPEIDGLSNQSCLQMLDIIGRDIIDAKEINNKSNLCFVSFEEALKELVDIKNGKHLCSKNNY